MKTLTLRLLVLGFGAILSFGALQEPKVPQAGTGSFFLLSNSLSSNLSSLIFDAIDHAKQSIDIQIYALTDPTLIAKLKEASVTKKITIYYDTGASREISSQFSHHVTLHPYTKRKGLMHRKIICIDDNLCLFGSANFTASSLYWHYNSFCCIDSAKLNNFLKHRQKGDCDFEYGRAYLLPDIQDKALNYLKSRIRNARKSIHLAMFSLTHPVLIDEITKAKERGVKVFLYLDKLNFKKPSSALCSLIKKCDKVFEQNRAVLLHHKLCLIDNHILITGSTNWTKSGFKKNEEVLVILDKLEHQWHQNARAIFEQLASELEPANF